MTKKNLEQLQSCYFSQMDSSDINGTKTRQFTKVQVPLVPLMYNSAKKDRQGMFFAICIQRFYQKRKACKLGDVYRKHHSYDKNPF